MGTGSAGGLKCQEISHVFPDHVLIFNGACPVFRPVPFVELLQTLTRKFSAFIAEFRAGFCQLSAIPDDALFDRFVFRFRDQPAPGTMVLLPEIAHACATIQAAGCNEHRVKCLQGIVGHMIPVYVTASMTTKGMLSFKQPSFFAVSFNLHSTSPNILSAFSGGTNPIQDSKKASRMK